MKPPPIQWLPVFEASARHKSFRKAADELHVSPPAVSQQIKALEKYLEIKLFRRHGPRLELTDAGHFYYQLAADTVRSHQQGFKEFDRKYNQRSLRLNTPLFIAQEILIPNYLTFKTLEPNTELRITTGTEYIDFDTGIADAAIRFGLGHWQGLEAKLLCPVKVSPVCSPDYLKQNPIGKRSNTNNSYTSNSNTDTSHATKTSAPKPSFPTSDVHRWLNDQTLLSTNENYRDWLQYSPELQQHQGIVCDSYFSAIKSAEQGLGVALGIFPAINNWVNDGKLLSLTECLDSPTSYWLVCPKEHARSALIDSCYRWAKQLFDGLPELSR
jgi:LysR family glycine cleavage system transcriptional activator